MHPVHAIIADRLATIRSLVTDIIAEAAPHAVTVEAADSADLHRALVRHPEATLVLIDESIVGNSEDALFAHVRKLAPAAAIGVLSNETDRERVLEAIYYGAVAVILKETDRDGLAAAMRPLLAGQVAFPWSVLAPGPVPSAPKPRAADLTRREREIVGLIGQGHSGARIAEDLKLSPHTVRVHVTRIMKKLDLPDRPALTHYAVTRHHGQVDRAGSAGQATRRTAPASDSELGSLPSSMRFRPRALAR